MKVFLDTNIFLDFALVRENSENTKKILELMEDDYIDFFVADITLINIDYIAKKEVSNIRQYLKYISANSVIVGGNNTSLKNALNIENKDLEDNLQYCLALEQSCDYIVTNDKNFLKKDIKVISSEEFVLKYVD